MLQVPIPKTEMMTWSLTLSYSTGRLPVHCSIRIPVDATLADLHRELNELDPALGLHNKRLFMDVMSDHNVIGKFLRDADMIHPERFPLSRISLSLGENLIVFVLPGNGNYLGSRMSEQYDEFHPIPQLKENMKVQLRRKDMNGNPMKGVIRELVSDFCLKLTLEDNSSETLMITDIEGGERYMPVQGDYIIYYDQ